MITDAKLNKYREDLNAVLRDWAVKNNLQIGVINFRYSENQFKASITFDELNEDGSRKINSNIVRQLTELLNGTKLEGQSPFGHKFRTERGTEAKLVGYTPYRKYEYEIEEYNSKKGKTEDLFCNLKYLKRLQDPV